MIGRYLTHPQVVIDPDISVQNWGLNEIGRARVDRLIASGKLRGTTHIVSSAEQKARDTAVPIAKALAATLEIRPDTHENDRSATGYLPREAFEATADAFFAKPDRSVRGWETARAAQTRIVREVEAALSAHATGDILIVGHGAVGTLLYCHFANVPISRKLDQFDQFDGGGSIFTFDIETRTALSHWAKMEDA